MQRAFVIGGTGMIGRTLLADLRSDCAAGAVEVRAGIRSPGHAAALAAPGIIPVPFDLDDRLVAPDRLIDAMRGSQTLFLLTGYTVHMLAQSKAAIDAARVAGIEHIVHLGLYAAADTTGIHQGWHQLIETYIEASGMAWTHLQPNWFMSNFQNFQMATGGGGRAETGGTIVLRGFLSADKRVSWIDADDIARAAAAVIRDPTRHKSKAYRLVPEALSFGEVIDLARRFR